MDDAEDDKLTLEKKISGMQQLVSRTGGSKVAAAASKQKQRIRNRARWMCESTRSTAERTHVQSTILGLSSEGGRKEKRMLPEFKVEAQRKPLLFSQHLPGTDGCF
ncbi:hypothetical protein BHM03_00018769 [Ensete ventricosum]|nr:hypothetical protein BHM03_00018769 [Ensete ventricosum]